MYIIKRKKKYQKFIYIKNIFWYNFIESKYNNYVNFIFTTWSILKDQTRVGAKRRLKRQPYGCFFNIIKIFFYLILLISYAFHNV